MDGRLNIIFVFIAGSKWSKTDLTYKISDYSKKISRQDTLAQIERAFKVSFTYCG